MVWPTKELFITTLWIRKIVFNDYKEQDLISESSIFGVWAVSTFPSVLVSEDLNRRNLMDTLFTAQKCPGETKGLSRAKHTKRHLSFLDPKQEVSHSQAELHGGQYILKADVHRACPHNAQFSRPCRVCSAHLCHAKDCSV